MAIYKDLAKEGYDGRPENSSAKKAPGMGWHRPRHWAGVGVALNDLPLGIGAGMLVGAIISILQKRRNDQEKAGRE